MSLKFCQIFLHIEAKPRAIKAKTVCFIVSSKLSRFFSHVYAGLRRRLNYNYHETFPNLLSAVCQLWHNKGRLGEGDVFFILHSYGKYKYAGNLWLHSLEKIFWWILSLYFCSYENWGCRIIRYDLICILSYLDGHLTSYESHYCT